MREMFLISKIPSTASSKCRKKLRPFSTSLRVRRLTEMTFSGIIAGMQHELYGVKQPNNNGTSLSTLRGNYLVGDGVNETDSELVRRARQLAVSQWAPATLRLYDATMRSISAWCAFHKVCPLPMGWQVVPLLITSLAEEGYCRGSIERYLTVIRQAHKYSGFQDPTRNPMVKATLRGAQRVFGWRVQGKAAFSGDDIRNISELVRTESNPIRAVRDLAIIIVGFVSGMRRAELAAVWWAHLDWSLDRDIVTITIPESKTDQCRRGQHVTLHRSGRPSCPLDALDRWRKCSAQNEGPVFRKVGRLGQIGSGALSGETIARVIQHYAERLDYNPGDYGAHSLRAGFITAALQAPGVRDIDVMRQVRHTQIETTLRYYRPKNEVNLTEALGL